MGLLSRLKAAARTLWQGPVAEATSEEIFGTPVPLSEYFTFNGRLLSGVGPFYGPEQRRDRNATLRTLQDHDRARNSSRVLAETNPNAIGLLQRLVAYNVGKGSSTEVHAAAEDAEPPVRLARKTREFVDAFKKQSTHQNQWPKIEREMVWRLHVDGEFFLRFFPQKDGITRVRFVESQNVRPPLGEDAEGEWSYGIHTPDDDAASPAAYCIHDFRKLTYEVVEAQFVIHAKINCLANQKRGVPSLYAVEGELVGCAKLRHATREGEKNRASITYFRRHKAASQGTIEGIRADRARAVATLAGFDPPTNASQVYVEVIEPGSTVDIPEGLDPLPPPGSPNTQGSSESVKQALEAVAARFGVPYWIASGDSGATNFAASLTAESPFAVTVTDSQADLAELSDAAQTKAIEIGAEQGLLPEDVLEQVDLLVSFPSPVSRNKLEETNRRKTLHDSNVLSETTWMTEEGLDPEKERQQMIEERRDPIPPQPTRVPSLPVDPATGQTATSSQIPSGSPAARYAQLTEQELADAVALWELVEAARVVRQEGEEWTTNGRKYRRTGGKTVYLGMGKRDENTGGARQTKGQPSAPKKRARPDPDAVHDAVKAAMASGKKVTVEGVKALADHVGALTKDQIADVRKRLGMTKGKDLKKDAQVKGIVDRLMAAVAPDDEGAIDIGADEPAPAETPKPAQKPKRQRKPKQAAPPAPEPDDGAIDLGADDEPAPPARQDTLTPERHAAARGAVIDAAGRLPVVSVADLRKKLAGTADGADFDAVIKQMADDGDVIPYGDANPEALRDDEMVRDGGSVITSLTLTDRAKAKPVAPPEPGPTPPEPPKLPQGATKVSDVDGLVQADVPGKAGSPATRQTIIDPARAKEMGAKVADSIAPWLRDVLPVLDPLTVTTQNLAEKIQEKHEQATGERLSYADAMHAVQALADAGLVQLHVRNETRDVPEAERARSMWRDGAMLGFAMAPRRATQNLHAGHAAVVPGWADEGLAKLKGGR